MKYVVMVYPLIKWVGLLLLSLILPWWVSTLLFGAATLEVVMGLQHNQNPKINASVSIPTILKHLDQGVALFSPQGQLLHVTPIWKRWLNWPFERSIEASAFFAMEQLKNGFEQSSQSLKRLRMDWKHQERHYESVFTPLLENNQLKGILLSTVDMTRVEQLEQVQSDFLADMSHEIKTPLAAILGASEILIQNDKRLTEQEREEFQTIINQESARINRLIEELANTSKLGDSRMMVLKKSSVNVKSLIQEVEQAQSLQLKKANIAFHNVVNPLLHLHVDKEKFYLIFSNLLSNSIRYTYQGTIRITTDQIGSELRIYVMDTGSGIPPQLIDRIFDRFFRTDSGRGRDQGGTGLGLAITRTIIEAHQGTIEVESTVGKGTTFILTFPLESNSTLNA
jgi:signal transduction histidine kinase